MGSTNFGTQVCTVGYGASAISTSWNTHNVGIVATGIYKGGYLSVVSGNVFSVDTLMCEITDGTYQVRINTTAPQSLTFVSSAASYVVLRWAYSASATNYMDMLLVGAGDVHTNDLVLGRCISVAGALSTFDYGDATFPRSTPKSRDVALRVEAEQAPSALRVWARAGHLLNAGGTGIDLVYDTQLTFSTASAATRTDLVHASGSGFDIVEGASGGAVPTYPSWGMVVAQVTITPGMTIIQQSDILDVRL